MRLTFRSKLIAIVAVAAIALLVLMVASSLIERRVDQKLQSIQQHYLPRIGLQPQLESSFERIGRTLQDAATAGDTDLLVESQQHLETLLAQIDAAGTAIAADDATRLGAAIRDYHAAAHEVSRRLIAGDSGDAMLAAVEAMQAKQATAAALLGQLTAFDERALNQAFASVAAAQQTGSRIRLIVILACLISTLGITIWIGRDLFRNLAELAAGFRRFGNGEFTTTIPVATQDELGDVAAQANQMAARLHELGRERDRSDWIKSGQAGLVEQLQGELSPDEIATRASAFLARHLGATSVAIHYDDVSAAAVVDVVMTEPWSEQATELMRSARDRLTIALEVARARAAIEQKADELARASTYKSQFLASMSHELRTPLNAIIGFSELMYDGMVKPETPQHHEFLGHILSSGRHLLEMINDVLDLSKIEAGKLEFHPAPIELERVFAEVLGILGTTATSRQIGVHSHIDPAVGELVLDPARLKQVLYNYLSNAIKFTPVGGRVEVRAIAEGADAFRLEVSDTGIGIDVADVGRLFADFQQIGDEARRAGGTGLGLALTRRLVEAQGGSVGVRSVRGEGSVFHAILPRISAVTAS